MKEEYCTLSPSKADGVLFDVSNKKYYFFNDENLSTGGRTRASVYFFAHYGMSNVDFLKKKKKKKLVKSLY